MDPIRFAEIEKLSDRELLERVQILAGREREATTALIAHLAVVDERRLHLGEGCSSLFTYCTQRLRLSESGAYRRVEAARLVRRFPVILEMLSVGRITLTTIRLLAPELTPANHRDLLEAATHKCRLDVERFVAGLRPQPPGASMVRRLPSRTPALVFDPPDGGHAFGAAVVGNPSCAPGPLPPLILRPAARPVITPLSPNTYKIQFTASEETHGLLRQAQDLLRHQIPSGDVGEVMTKALRLLVRHLEREKTAVTDHPRARRAVAPRSRHIPADVRRAVWRRDAGRCAFVGHDGCQCTERAFLEFHHIVPYAAGGAATEDNVELRCRAHNSYEAERWPERRAGRQAGHAPAPGAAY